MAQKFKSVILVLIAVLIFPLCTGCAEKEEIQQSDIVILFTSDVHCNFDGSIGYAGLAAYKKAMSEKCHVTLVDCGDAVQGNYYGAVSNGGYAVELMNLVGYDFAAIGNHEFDYGLERFGEIVSESKAQYLACNIEYTGSGKNVLSDVKPYEIVKYGDVSVAFVGISTPETITSSAPAYFMEDGKMAYDLYYDENGTRFYERVQKTIDECKAEGADYVVAIAHLGDDVSSAPYTSTELIAATEGIDLLFDGHAHSTVPCRMTANRAGKLVPVAESGRGLDAFGQAVITSNGLITVGLITEYNVKDEAVASHIDSLEKELEDQFNKVIANSKSDIKTHKDDIRLVRNRETTAGDFCADAYRAISGADVGFVNGGGIRAELSVGDVTYGNMISMMPYGNKLCVVEATGQEIVDALEFASRHTLSITDENGNAVGENGGFLQVSGLKYTIDTSIASSVETDDIGLFVSVGDTRRVSDVQILQDGQYVPIDVSKTYTVASHNYLIKDCGDGFTMFSDNKLIIDEGLTDYEMLIEYIVNHLGGTIGENYNTIDGRITVK